MKANNGKGNNESRDDWETPKWLFEELNKQYKFDFDCCASKENTKCRLWTDNFKIIEVDSNGISWMNPPFSKSKEMFEHFFKVIKKGIAIYRCDNMETKVWQDIILKGADWIFIPSQRIAYEGKEGKGSRFPSALIGVGVKDPKNLKGVVLFISK